MKRNSKIRCSPYLKTSWKGRYSFQRIQQHLLNECIKEKKDSSRKTFMNLFGCIDIKNENKNIKEKKEYFKEKEEDEIKDSYKMLEIKINLDIDKGIDMCKSNLNFDNMIKNKKEEEEEKKKIVRRSKKKNKF